MEKIKEQLGKQGEYHDNMLLQNSEEERISKRRKCSTMQLFNFCKTRIDVPNKFNS